MSSKLFREKLLAISLVASYLLNGLLTSPYGSVDIDVNSSTFPYFSVVIATFFIRPFRLHRTTVFLFAYFLLSLMISVKFSNIWLITLLHLITILIVLNYINNQEKVCEFIFYSVLTYFILSFLIYGYRIQKYNFDLIRTRAGVNIWGGNVLTAVALLSQYILLALNDKRHKYIMLLALFNSLIFINRLSIFLLLFLVIFWFSTWRKIIQIIVFSFVLGIAGLQAGLTSWLSDTNLYAAFLLRFSGDDPLDTRWQLWGEGIHLIKTYPFFGTGLGGFVYFGHHTSAHNIVLNTLAESGIILGIPILFLSFRPLILLLQKLRFSKKAFTLFF